MNEIEPHNCEQHTCSSDMYAALENLERMFQAYRFCMNKHAANAVLFGMAIEAQMLALKMKAMLARWNKYLPFHEVMDVNFEHWLNTVSEWMEILGMNPSDEVSNKYLWLVGCREYMLDLYAQIEAYDEEGNLIARTPEFYEVDIKDDYQREMAAYMERTDELLCEMAETDIYQDDWRGDVNRMVIHTLRELVVGDKTMPFTHVGREIMEQIEQEIKGRFESLMEFSEVDDCALLALGNLQNQLCDLQALFNKALPNEMFIRLSTRLFYRHCMGSYREGETGVNKWRNNWPEAKVKKHAEKKKEELKKQLAAKSYGAELQEYISFDAPNLFRDSSFGRFLFKNRKELSIEDVKYIHKVCRELNLLNELISEERENVSDNSAPIRQLNAEEQEIIGKLEALVKRAHSWTHIGGEQVVAALHKALGLGPVFADTKQVEMSQALWALFRKRRGCDREKSLMVTWLNIVGYCVKRGFLSGGSPALAKRFFPKCGKDDYKAIDKGRNAENNKNFLAITPLLDACFRVGGC